MTSITDDDISRILSRFATVTISTNKRFQKLKIYHSQEVHYIGRYKLGRIVGKGKCGHVHLAYSSGGKNVVAIKLLPKSLVSVDSIQRLAREMNALNELRHPNIISINEIVVDRRFVGLVMPYASQGDVFKYLYDNGPISEVKAHQWFGQLVWAVDDMHSKCYVHRDIKPENLLVDGKDNLLLTDFEMCESFRRQGFPFVLSVCGSPTYCPPEAMLKTNAFDACKADIWAMGITLYTMVAGYLPFDDRNYYGSSPGDIVKLYNHISVTPLNLPSHFTLQLKDLLLGMLDKNPSKRLSLADVKRHAWLKSHASLWLCPTLGNTISGMTLRNSPANSFPSTPSLQTLSDKMTECKKQFRGPIIWDPNAGYELPNMN